MLGKTANGLFWMSRYLERAENTARFVETGQRTALTRLGGMDEDWSTVLNCTATLGAFQSTGRDLTKDAAIDWLLRAPENPSSVLSSVEAARRNARLVRTAITGEVWEAINAAYITTRRILGAEVTERDLPMVLHQIQQDSAMVRGMTHGTMLRNDIYNFQRLGTLLERADNTTRILSARHTALVPPEAGTPMAEQAPTEHVIWESMLRLLSARGGFRMEYGAEAEHHELAHFLILDPRMPRSIGFTVRKVRDNLGYLENRAGESSASKGMADRLVADYLETDIPAIHSRGLQTYLRGILTGLDALSGQIERDFRFYE